MIFVTAVSEYNEMLLEDQNTAFLPYLNLNSLFVFTNSILFELRAVGREKNSNSKTNLEMIHK